MATASEDLIVIQICMFANFELRFKNKKLFGNI